MRKAFKHTGVLMMVAVIGLAVVGAAYALWFEDLQLTANVSTGTFNADVSYHPEGTAAVVALPPSTQPITGGVATYLANNYALFTQANFPVDKPQPTCNGAVTNGGSPLTANDQTDNNVLTLNMTGLYPYAGCQFEIDLHNAGSVPFHIAITGVTLTCLPTAGCAAALAASPDGSPPWSIGIDPSSPPGCHAFLDSIATWSVTGHAHQINLPSTTTPVQIHNGTDLVCMFKLIADQNPASEGLNYVLTATYRAYQWNEQPYGP